MVYSGDTEPCESLVDIGQGADLLIHEATFDPEMIQDARKKRHCTIAEAINIAKKMNAKRTILTHFSQRYPKFPKGIPEDSINMHCLSVAFDGYCLPWTLLDDYHKFMPYFRDLLE
jgi:ribonuclease BN (tRNA processing enzyme)